MNAQPVLDGPRACRPDEVNAMIAMANSVMRQGSTQSFLTDYPLVYAEENLPNVQILKSGPTIASVVPFLPKSINYAGARFQIGIISPTATHPDHRRLGYARRCLDAGLARMEETGIELSVLWTQPATFPFYEQAGFQAVPSQLDWVQASPDDVALFRKGGHSVTLLDPSNAQHLLAVENLRDRSHAGVIRSRRDIEALFSLPKTFTYLARDAAGEILAYLFVCEGTHKPGILEADGHPDAVESLVYHALTTTAAQNMPVYLTKNAAALSLLMQKRMGGRIRPMEAGPMMVRINDAFAFLSALRPWLEVQAPNEMRNFSLEIAETGQIVGLTFDPDRNKNLILGHDPLPDHRIVSRRELVSLIFGAREPVSATRVGLPLGKETFHFPIPMLDHS